MTIDEFKVFKDEFDVFKEEFRLLKNLCNSNNVTLSNGLQYLKEQLILLDDEYKQVKQTTNSPLNADKTTKLLTDQKNLAKDITSTDVRVSELQSKVTALHAMVTKQSTKLLDLEYLKIPSIIPAKRTPVKKPIRKPDEVQYLVQPARRQLVRRLPTTVNARPTTKRKPPIRRR